MLPLIQGGFFFLLQSSGRKRLIIRISLTGIRGNARDL